MKKKQKVQIFKLEERVLFDGAAAAEIVAAVNNAGDANNADQADNDSDQNKDDKFVQNTVQNAGPVEMPVPGPSKCPCRTPMSRTTGKVCPRPMTRRTIPPKR